MGMLVIVFSAILPKFDFYTVPAMPTPHEKSSRSQTAGVVSIWEMYSLDELLARMRWTQSSYRAARRRGLRVLGHGKQRYVRGRDLIRFLDGQVATPANYR